ncbi:hypothetical protein CORMATOL_02361 [Corynebacterium matruchotii ATCC 33806]|uniref:Uncharacterized protein n=1 Tax=Corynebacterium matruchotii ATCC 33806 TaxID=566549 RepID=C0E5S9_9CORY|nr:hypothetical protein CORMATOL_02361 [Corynebacterium matruchotii ATCC 33806]
MGKFGLPAKYEVWQMICRESMDGLYGGNASRCIGQYRGYIPIE